MSENEKAFNFDYEFQNKLGNIGDMEEKLEAEIDTRLRKLTKGHTDITGARFAELARLAETIR